MSQLRFRRKEKKYTEVYNTIIFKNKKPVFTGFYFLYYYLMQLQ